MALTPDRVLMEGESPYSWERDALAFIKKALPAGDPYLAALDVELHAQNGAIHQLDAVVLGYHALYVVEVKSHPGKLEGNHADWTFTLPGRRPTTIDNPRRATEHKAKVLASLLQREIPDGARRPWVEPLVFLSDEKLEVSLTQSGQAGVVTAQTFAKAISFGEVPLSDDRLRRHVVNRPTMKAVAEALKKLLTPCRPNLSLGDFRLLKVIEEGRGEFQDWEAEHSANRELKRRVRVYPVPPSSTPEQHDQRRRAANREAQLLSALEHGSVLKVFDYRPQGPTGAPAVAFERFEGAQTLEAFVRRNPQLSFSDKVEIIQALAEALAYCHGKSIFHRGLHPGAVLVRRRVDNALELKLYNFQLATRAGSSIGTEHLTAFSSDPVLLYRAPEAIEDPQRAGTAEADLFSLGAIAYYVLTGQHPGADLAERHALLGANGLSVAAASDSLAGRRELQEGRQAEDAQELKSLDEVVAYATSPSPLSRADSVRAWLGLFQDASTRPDEPAEEEADPLQAGKDATLSGGLTVKGMLGSGSTARVLWVKREDQSFALKVPLSPEMEPRLAAEAEALRRAKCDRVVSLEGEPVLKGRHCLLLGYAGETLAALLAKEGPPSLDYARRWGDDLLSALMVLEERGVLHRDVKPANLGVLTGESKKARHLFLFDFSLAGADPARVELGTPAYRDPFLATRPGARWDSSSDRYSAAVTLHELLTGVLPRFGTGEEAAVASEGGVKLAVERFDASVRDRLVAFFEKALDRDVARRHESAEEMRTHWVGCFAPAQPRGDEAVPGLDDAALAALALETPVPSLPLSPAAKNALDRSGVVVIRELLALPKNQLSSIRGVGRGTVREILAFAERYRKLRTVDEAPPSPFWPAYRGADGEVRGVVAEGPAAALEDAGLGRLHAVAAAAKDCVGRILERFPGAEEALAGFLEKEQKRATGAPATVEGFLDLFLPASRGPKAIAWVKHVRALYGLDELAGATPGDAKSIAAVLGVTRPAVYLSVNRGRDKWRERPEQVAALRAIVVGALESLGRVAPLSRLATAVASALPHEPGQEAGPQAQARVEAVVRICAEVASSESEPGLILERVNDQLWAGADAAHLQAARALGLAADELAAQDPLAAADDVKRRLGTVAEKTPLAELAFERILSLASEASREAARSARLELFPRGMPAARALRLCAGALGAEIAPEEVARLVAARYPEAAALPARPELDALIAELKLAWSEERARYVRADLAEAPSRTEALSSRKMTAAAPAARRERPPEVQEAEEFEQTLRMAAQKSLFKVLDVNRAHAEDAAAELGLRLRVEPRSLERELIAAAWELMRELKVEEAVVLEADRAGPEGPVWMNLLQLMRLAADRLAAKLLAEKKPVVLKDPGLVARYRLDGLLEKLVRAAQDDNAPAVLLLNPVVDADGPQPIDAVTESLTIPVTAPAQRLHVPESWIRNLHRGGL